MKVEQSRIYLDGKLINVCYNEYVLMCNVVSLREKYGDRIAVEKLDKDLRDEEYKEWLENI